MAGALKRGDIVTVSAPGDYGRPRPAVVIQSDVLSAADSMLVVLLTGTVTPAPLYRLTVEPTAGNGSKAVSQVMGHSAFVDATGWLASLAGTGRTPGCGRLAGA